MSNRVARRLTPRHLHTPRYRSSVPVRRLRPGDAEAVADRVADRLRAAARREPLVAVDLDRAELVAALRAVAPGWVATGAGRITGHLAATLVDEDERAAWVTVDGATFDEPGVLAALLGRAAPAWRALGATTLRVWALDDDVGAWSSLGATAVARRGVRRLAPGREVATPDGVRLRRATTDDLEAALRLDALLEAADPGPAPRSDERRRADVLDHLTDPEVSYWLAERRGRAVAQLVSFDLSPRRGSRGPARHVSAVVVEPAERGRGLGTALVEGVLGVARDDGARFAEVTWRVGGGAGAFWRARGFSPTLTLLEERLAGL